MSIDPLKLYISKTEDFIKVNPTVEEEIVGFIKFSDYIKDVGEKENHFQQFFLFLQGYEYY